MFRNKKQLPSQLSAELEDALKEQGFVEGFIFLVAQNQMNFGSDRRNPVTARPAVRMRQPYVNESYFYLLPCTSKYNSAFFHLPKDIPHLILWIQPQSVESYVCPQVERIDQTHIHKKIGVISQELRVDLWKWLSNAQRN